MITAKKLFDTFIYFPIFKTGLCVGAISARLGWDGFTRQFMRLNAKTVLFIRRGKSQQHLSDVGEEWKRMFPSETMQKIVSVNSDTIYAETHGWCPLRGTGDVHACYNVMEFDRCMLEKIGGRFVVLTSQAEPGVNVCRIAIRKSGVSTDDLIPAHKKS